MQLESRTLPTVARDWVIPAAGAALMGTAVGLGDRLGALIVGAAGVALLVVLPLPWLFGLSLSSLLVFRLFTATSTGTASLIPDALILLVVARVAAGAAAHGLPRLPRGIRGAGLVLTGFFLVAVASTLVNRDVSMSLVGSIRQFARLPVWGMALVASGIRWREAKPLVRILLAASLIQLPFAVHQYRAVGGGDPVSGTFGSGGSGVMMLFLVMGAVLWTALALERAIPAWTLWLIGPALVLPMGLGSAAMFVVFLPLGLLVLFLRFSVARSGNVRIPTVLGLLFVLTLAGWAGKTFAVAPPCAGCEARPATTLLSDSYLRGYYRISLKQGPDSRLGFLMFSLHVDTHTGPAGAVVGQGPSASFIGAPSRRGLKLSLQEFTVLNTRSVQSLQRVLLGFGFLGALLYLIVLILPVLPFVRPPPVAADRTARALVLALPVSGLLFLLGGPYTAAYTDPGVAAAFWTLLAAAFAAARDAEGPPREECRAGGGEEAA